MGNRAILTVGTTKSAPGIYLHWNGGPESVLAFLDAAKELGIRSPEGDPDYFLARLGQIIGNFFGGTMSLGFGAADKMDDGDSGRYILGGDFKIIKAAGNKLTVESLDATERKDYDGIKAETLKKNKAIFASD